MNRPEEAIQVLYVEDDPTIAFLTRDSLELKGYEVAHVEDGVKALELFRERFFDICVVDVMLPRMDGFSLAAEIRKIDARIPVIFLTAKSMTEDKITGFKLGGDDYITKPFSVEELVLRMQVFLRRSQSDEVDVDKPLLEIGEYTFDPLNQRLSFAGREAELTRRESEVLEYLLKRTGNVVKRSEILNQLWGDDDYFLGRSLDVFISRLRKRLAGDPKVEIRNIHGVGFCLKVRK